MYNIYTSRIFYCLKNSLYCSIFSKGNTSNEHIRTRLYFLLKVTNSFELTTLTNLKDVEFHFGREIYPRLGYIKVIYSNIQMFRCHKPKQ